MTELEFHELIRSEPGVAHRCPTCSRNATAYKRTINRAQAAAMLVFARWQARQHLHPNVLLPFDAAELLQRESARLARKVGGDYARLRLWDLIEPARSGTWRMTWHGWSWVTNSGLASRSVLEFSGERIGQPFGELISFSEALGTPFNASGLIASDNSAELQQTLFGAVA